MAEPVLPGVASESALIFSAKQLLSASGSLEVVWRIPAKVTTFTVQVGKVDDGSYRVEQTASPYEDVVSGDADWYDCADGADQTEGRQFTTFGRQTCVRIKRLSGTWTAVFRS